MLDNYNFEYGRKDNLSMFHGVISDTNGRESSIRFFKQGEIDENCNIGENAEVLIDCEDNKTNKYDFVKQSIDKLMQEFLSIEPSEKNTMRRKDILGMIEKLNDMGSKNKVYCGIDDNGFKAKAGDNIMLNNQNFIIDTIENNKYKKITKIQLTDRDYFVSRHFTEDIIKLNE